MNKCELAFLLSNLKKAIYNLERVRAYDEAAVSEEVINNLKETLIIYNLKKENLNNEQ
jgi:hypothetical protein